MITAKIPTAREHQRILEAAESVHNRSGGFTTGLASSFGDVLLVENKLSTTIGVGDVVGIDGTAIPIAGMLSTVTANDVFELMQKPVIYKSTTAEPTGLTASTWGVAVTHAAPNDVCQVKISGLAAVMLTVHDADHQYCDIYEASTGVQSGTAGRAEVLEVATVADNGEQLALVNLGVARGILTTTLGGALLQGSSVLCEGAYTIHDDWLASGEQIASGAKVAAVHRTNKWYLLSANTCPEDQ